MAKMYCLAYCKCKILTLYLLTIKYTVPVWRFVPLGTLYWSVDLPHLLSMLIHLGNSIANGLME